MSGTLRLLAPLLLAVTLTGCAGLPTAKSEAGASSADPEQALRLARLLRDNGRMAAAYGVYARADQRGQLSPEQSLEYAQVSSAILTPLDALPLYVRARQRLADDKLSAEQRFNLCLGIGRGQLASSQWSGATDSFNCALQAKPANAEALNGLAVTHSAQGNQQEAERLLNQALQSDPSNKAALNNLALGKLAQNQPQAAIDLLEGADLKNQPTLVLNLALAHLLQQDEPGARQALQQHLPRVHIEPLLAGLKGSAQRIRDGQPPARELLAASRHALTLDALQ
ncbi:tetratricopeptide repeat protein [Pseudomonas sp. LJDD11]|uniref:tetratricopeptide repeat protein n=1 Tax=Pseudomonas sp. LJDD11 TaxID=2931984 RepID=UPI00211CB4E7|nr:tetratricopeptide repeat protein [Pseudomonas sp. LJDD11]MCQ9427202.1 tetratricopeptide repeat protein [Pseudomonas sp. LJDD11]